MDPMGIGYYKDPLLTYRTWYRQAIYQMALRYSALADRGVLLFDDTVWQNLGFFGTKGLTLRRLHLKPQENQRGVQGIRDYLWYAKLVVDTVLSQVNKAGLD